MPAPSLRLAVYHSLPSGGAKRALWHQLHGLSRRHQIDLYTSLPAVDDGLALEAHAQKVYRTLVPTEFIPNSSFWRLLNPTLFALRLPALERHFQEIAQRINAGTYDAVLVCHGLVTTPYLVKYLSHPGVYYCQEPYRQAHDKIPTHRDAGWVGVRQALTDAIRLDRQVLQMLLKAKDLATVRHAQVILCNSQFSRQRIQQAYGREAQVNYLGVDEQKFHPLNLPRENFILSVGEVHPRKGFDLIVEALGQLPIERRPALRIICFQWDPREKSYLEGLAQARQVDLAFIRHVPDEQLVELYNKAAVTVFMPLREPFGLVTLEAMACGSPVIGVDEGGLRETVVEGVTGYLVPRDAGRLAQAIERLRLDPALTQRLGQAGRQAVLERWTWERSVQELEQFLYQASLRR